MLFFPNCKINIGLDVLARRDDGFHELATLMYPVKGLCDWLEIVPADDQLIDFKTSGLTVDCDPNDNICVKAARLMQNEFGVSGARIHLHKVVPFGAGLGGGSADAAFVIKGFNSVFGLGLGEEQMEELASRLGSDTAFFIKNSPALATSRGEVLRASKIDLNGLYIIVLKPSFGVSTAEAYAGVVPQLKPISLAERLSSEITQWQGCIENDFEKHIFELYPRIAELKKALYDSGALYASMSGSGSSVYGIFSDKIDVKYILSEELVYQGFMS